MKKKPGMYGVLLLLLSLPLAACAEKARRTADFPAPLWMLEAGIAAAILLAVAVLVWQYRSYRLRDEKRQKAREQEQESAEARSLLCSARHELAFFYMGYREGAGAMLGQIGDGGYLEHAVPVEHERYYIYPICASGIGKIRDVRLGKYILLAYTTQIRFAETMKWNNNLLRWLRDEQKGRGEYRETNTDAASAREALEDNLKAHVPKMATAFDEMEQATRIVLEYINEDGTINPRSKHRLHSQYDFLNTPQSVRYK
ncbi:MAG: hypothetical protein LBM56_04165 [Burkholderiaceae bacterium]|nr:hypothetical protein [Burkholderiaceae bacterium]